MNEVQADPITIIEMRAYIGLLLLFGAMKKNDVEIHEMWSSDSINHSFHATSCMSRDRFKLISSCIYFDDYNTREKRKHFYKKFYKMIEIFSMFRENIRFAYDPVPHLCIDETLYSYRGNCSHRQYMPKKPAKYGLKFNSITCTAYAYLLETLPYLGKSNENDNNAKNLGQKLVESLSEFYYGTKRYITMDNYFTSIPMANKLYENDLAIIGTFRHNKVEIPPSFLENKEKELFSSRFAFDKFMTLVSYTAKVKINLKDFLYIEKI